MNLIREEVFKHYISLMEQSWVVWCCKHTDDPIFDEAMKGYMRDVLDSFYVKWESDGDSVVAKVSSPDGRDLGSVDFGEYSDDIKRLFSEVKNYHLFKGARDLFLAFFVSQMKEMGALFWPPNLKTFKAA
ncbi:MAG TPA: hypothetical protein VK031_01470 [Tissierellaceae bacterium]|nr:hypothetical protein [Tissierellaceae bacterium]